MSEQYRRNVVEAALLAAGRSLQLVDLAQVFEDAQRPSDVELKAILDALQAEYATRALELAHTASGWRIQVRGDYAGEVSKLWPERPARYSRALLETLALIAYRQPITRGEIELVRGVAVNPNIIKTLLERNWIRVIGTRDVPGRPEVLGTTHEFLDYFGLKKLEQLPPLAELKALTELNVQLELPGPAAAPPPEAIADSSAEVDAEAEAEAEDMNAEGDPLDDGIEAKGLVAAADHVSDP
ncbi:MAG TPA: SMC-Scp complex subunit ScpB [Steroidobacteraceae bacterium]|jgi:segregation and condensation protein B|nr:SMC-Scp complex subunit ScpB [Steroidobacteraceae bacterium]